MEPVVAGFAAWAPGLEDAASWEAWSRAPAPLAREGVPDVGFLPPMLRRRCTPLTRIMLRAAFDACPDAERAEVRTLFASRHGSINESIEMIDAVVEGRAVSPSRFSHTVHNAQAGLFSIAAGNRCASSSLAAQGDTFPMAFLEALTHLHREPGRQVLLVVGDVPLAPRFAPLVREPAASWAVALRLAAAGDGPRVSLALGEPRPGDAAGEIPQAAAFLGWWLRGEPALELPGARCRFLWKRLA